MVGKARRLDAGYWILDAGYWFLGEKVGARQVGVGWALPIFDR